MNYTSPPSTPLESKLASVPAIIKPASAPFQFSDLSVSSASVKPIANSVIRFSNSKLENGLTTPLRPHILQVAQAEPITVTDSHLTEDLTADIETGHLGTAADLQDLTPISVSNFSVRADAHSTNAQTSDGSEESNDLRIRPRFGAGYITAGGSFDALGRFEAFVPLWQEVGEELGLLEGRLVVGENSNIGGSLLLGYREFNEDHNRIRGGYVGFDVRGTEGGTFYQLGTGYESLGENWDFRFNAYLPIGDRTNTINDINVDTGLQVSTEFVGNQFVLNNRREQQRLIQNEVALGGLDAEAGYRLAQWDEGDLSAFGGLYVYGSPSTPTYLGWRLRLASNFTPNFNGGLALQDDGLFGTRLVLSVGATFPGNRPKGPIEESDIVRARLGESIVRLPEIAVFVDEDSEITVEQNSEPLMNPEEDEAYRFQHVTLGATGGDGTFENPFGTVQEALDATVSDGNDVVYIDGDADVLIPSFTIPDRVQVLSQGPTQTLAGLPFTGFESATVRLPFSPDLNYENGIAVELPFSGDGNFPRIENGVTLGDRTVLAGFQINDAAGDAIAGSNISNVELRNNTIVNAAGRGIAFDNVGGSAVIFDNVVRNSTGQGVFVENSTTESALDLAIVGYELENNLVGLDFSTLASSGLAGAPSQVISIGPSDASLNTSSGTSEGTAPANAIVNSTNEGLLVRSEGTATATVATQEVAFDAGTITNSGSDGVRITANNGAGSQELSVTNSSITNNGGAGIEVRNGLANPLTTAYAQEIFIRSNEITDNAASGVDIELNAAGAQEVTIDGNQILRNGGDGIRSVASVSGLQEFPILEGNIAGISGNTISGNAEQAIDVEVNDSATLAVLNVRDNQLEDNGGGPDLDVRATAASTRTCVIIAGNTVPSGIELGSLSTSPTTPLFLVQGLNTLSFDNNNAPVQFINDNTSTADISAFTEDTNSCIP